ncbi:MAG TPA: cyclodeaminase/cyclohydrolase family protein [Candidatus Omnitrophota bacterium]|nr:cyclodeaminase/cyclohydrolase family protein [Candidatus Omnitrophota bacterium]HRZ14957.1 cyclodeaminase/cyclohydrolase family protein [Candidatus Omnitrophota bacterium]
MMYKDSSLKQYCDDVAAKLAAPGGGSVSALTACMGVSLLSMVINFTLGKPRFARYEALLRRRLEDTEKLRRELLRLVDLDVAAFKSGSARDAFAVPLMICRLSLAGGRLCKLLLTSTNPALISDIGVAAVLLEAAFAGAAMNVDINLKTLDDASLSRKSRRELAAGRKQIQRIRANVEEYVGKVIGR